MTRLMRPTSSLLVVAFLLVLGVLIFSALGANRVSAQRRGGRSGMRGGAALSNLVVGRVLTRGEVKEAEQATGRVEIKVEGGMLEAAFPPREVSDLKAGDVVFVTMTLIDPRAAAVTGSVAAVDRTQGTMTITTARGPLTLRPSVDVLTSLNIGDPLLMKLELVDIGPSLDLEKKN